MNKNLDLNLEFYKITTSKEVLKYYQYWTKKNKYNQDMVDMNYTAPKETVSVLVKHAFQKDMKILVAHTLIYL